MKSRWTLLFVTMVGVVVLAGCGGAADTAELGDIAQAVSATLAAMPTSTPQIVEVTRVVDAALLTTPTPASVPSPPLVETPAPTLSQLVPPRRPYIHSYSVTEEYDRFEDRTSVNLEPDYEEMASLKQGTLWVSYSYQGQTPHAPSTVVFALWSMNDDWEYLRCHSLNLLIDGSPLALETQHQGEVIAAGMLSETVMGTIGTRDFLALTNADVVEGELCNAEFKLSSDQMQALKDVASRMAMNTIESLAPTKPPPAYDLALVRVEDQDTVDGFTVTGAFHNLGDKPTPQLIVLVTFTNSDTGASVTQQQSIGPLAPDVTETFSAVNPSSGNWNYQIELTAPDGESLRYRDLSD